VNTAFPLARVARREEIFLSGLLILSSPISPAFASGIAVPKKIARTRCFSFNGWTRSTTDVRGAPPQDIEAVLAMHHSALMLAVSEMLYEFEEVGH